ncbi:hypothetical protein L7F22_038015 [Adiantum nelumboides]|nr:hypothetical protein [Adiantum nelumboides]
MTKPSKRGAKDLESALDLETSSSAESNTKSSFDEEEKKKKKSSSKKKKKEKTGDDEGDLIQQSKNIGYSIIALKDKRYYEIREKYGHTTAQCWYNPKQRGKPPSVLGEVMLQQRQIMWLHSKEDHLDRDIKEDLGEIKVTAKEDPKGSCLVYTMVTLIIGLVSDVHYG